MPDELKIPQPFYFFSNWLRYFRDYKAVLLLSYVLSLDEPETPRAITSEEITLATGLSQHDQVLARKLLCNFGLYRTDDSIERIWYEKRCGMPARNHYWVNVQLFTILNDCGENE